MRSVARHLDLSPTAARYRCHAALASGWLVNLADGNGKYDLAPATDAADDLPMPSGLPAPLDLAKAMARARGAQGISVETGRIPSLLDPPVSSSALAHAPANPWETWPGACATACASKSAHSAAPTPSSMPFPEPEAGEARDALVRTSVVRTVAHTQTHAGQGLAEACAKALYDPGPPREGPPQDGRLGLGEDSPAQDAAQRPPVPDTSCRPCGGRRFWLPTSWTRWICVGCHPPAVPSLVAEWYEVPARPERGSFVAAPIEPDGTPDDVDTPF
jgi:hypothetical protein